MKLDEMNECSPEDDINDVSAYAQLFTVSDKEVHDFVVELDKVPIEKQPFLQNI